MYCKLMKIKSTPKTWRKRRQGLHESRFGRRRPKLAQSALGVTDPSLRNTSNLDGSAFVGVGDVDCSILALHHRRVAVTIARRGPDASNTLLFVQKFSYGGMVFQGADVGRARLSHR